MGVGVEAGTDVGEGMEVAPGVGSSCGVAVGSDVAPGVGSSCGVAVGSDVGICTGVETGGGWLSADAPGCSAVAVDPVAGVPLQLKANEIITMAVPM